MSKKNKRKTQSHSVEESSEEPTIALTQNQLITYALLGLILLITLFNAFSIGVTNSEVMALSEKVDSLGTTVVDDSDDDTTTTQPTGTGSGPVEVDDSVLEGLPVKGDPNAPVTMIEFFDYACGFCKRHHDNTAPLIEQNYVDSGKVKIIYADFISVGNSLIHEAAYCVREQAGDEAFFNMKDDIYANQSSLSEELLTTLAVSNGAEEAEFDECLSSRKYQAQITATTQYGRDLGFSGTPGFLIGNEQIKGAFPYESFESAFESELAN
jgi:protein-disulfide isomerase